jgi:hypothetical protein
MEKKKELIDFLRKTMENPASMDSYSLSFHIARAFVNHQPAEPDEYMEEIESLCAKLSLDCDEMISLIGGSLHKVQFPHGKDYSYAVALAVTEQKRFRIVCKNKRFTMINIMFRLSEIRGHRPFNIPAKLVATSAKTTEQVVYAFINELLRRGIIEEVAEEDIKNGKGRLFQWLDIPEN